MSFDFFRTHGIKSRTPHLFVQRSDSDILSLQARYLRSSLESLELTYGESHSATQNVRGMLERVDLTLQGAGSLT